MRSLILIVAAALGAGAGAASAQSSIACTAAVSSGTLSFGNVVPQAPAGVTALLGDLIVRCSNPDNVARTVRMRLAISAGVSGNVGQRQMRRGGAPAPLLYNLYEDPAYSVVWTDTTGGRPDELLRLAPRSTGELRVPIFGRIPGGQSAVTAGLYSDTLVATVRY
jgi:spore coat protein U-like protein